MEMARFDPRSGTFRDAATVELQASNGQNDMEYSFLDYVARGTVSAITSATVGLINTGYALGETLGIADEESYLDEGETIEAIWGEQTGEFYQRHKTGIDAAGMVAGSFVPGLGAVKVLRMAQRAGKLPVMTQLKTGMRNPDILLNSRALETAKQSVFTTKVPGVRNPEVLRAYAGGIGQGFMESVAFDMGIVAAMNQNAMLNPEDLGYLESGKNILIESLPFTFIGGALGGGLEVLKAKGAIKKWVDAEWERTGEFHTPAIDALVGLTGGDKLIKLGEASAAHSQLAKKIKEGDNNARASWEAGQNQIKTAILDVAEELGISEKSQLNALQELMDSAGSGELENVSKIISGMTRMGRVTATDFSELTRYYDKMRGVTGVIQGANFEDVAEGILQRQNEFKQVLKDIGQDEFSERLVPNEFLVGLFKPRTRTAQGFAFPQESGGNTFRMKLGLIRSGDKRMMVPDFMTTNAESLKEGYEINKTVFKRLGEKFDVSFEEYAESTFLHELGHIKSNTAKMLNWVQNSISIGTNRDALRDLVSASVKRRKLHWKNKTTGGIGTDEDTMIREVMDYFENPVYDPNNQPRWLNYLGTPEELLADGAAYFAQEGTRQLAAKQLPHLAKIFSQGGSIAKSWDDTKAFYNASTKKTVSSALPGINDFSKNSKVAISKKSGVLELYVPEAKKSFKQDRFLFGSPAEQLKAGKANVLDYDAQWNMVARTKVQHFLPKDATARIIMESNDLPVMEKIALALKEDETLRAKYGNRIELDGDLVSPEELLSTLISRKRQLRDEMVLDNTSYINEHKIQKILNVSEEFAMGNNSADALLLGSKNFEIPELHKVQYKHKTPEDYTGAAISMQGFQYRDEIITQQRNAVAAELIGDNFGDFSEVPWEKIYGVSPTSQRTSLVGGLRTEFGSLREWAQYIGKLTTQALNKTIQRTDEEFVEHYDTFNRGDNYGLRMELAQVDNLARRQWYYNGKYTDKEGTVKNVLVNKHTIIEAFDALNKEMGGELGEWSTAYLEDLPPELMERVLGARRGGDNAVVELSDEVANFVGSHINRNRDIVKKKQRLASAKGREAVYDPDVYYTPPRNLQREKFSAFVVPNQAMAGSDPRTFMVFGQTQTEFNAKMAQISEKFGSKYRVITQDEVSQYKRLVGEYEKGEVFDELFFDSSLARQGTSSELLPNLDVTSSGTLDRYREWTIRQEEALFRNGVELKYADVVESLKRLDREYSKIGRTSLDKRYKEQDSIWKDTLNIMTSQRGYGSMAEQMFVRVNDFLGNVGSETIDKAMDALRPGRSGINLTDENMMEFNRQLEAAGIEAPTRNAIEAITSSPKIKNSATLNQLVRTLSNFTSLGMLRMDWAHSMLQVMSTPILGLPVLKELQTSLRGQARQQLDNMTTVVNPATGVKEPSPYKLFAEGTQKFFTAEGKEFMKELRDRNIISDYLIQYLDTLDFSSFNGAHTLQQVSAKTDQIAKRLSKISLFTQSEEMTRFQIAWAAKRIGEIGGKSQDELWPIISSSVDKVHGVYIGNQRPQFFQGVLGQAVGLYQTYFFNFIQNMMKFYQGGETKSLATLAGMQTSIFGIQSWTGFDQLNQLIGQTNSGNLDLFGVSGADDPNSTAAYFMYGLGSHALGFPIDFYSRGDLAVRHSTVLPTSFGDFPVVSTMAKAAGNIYNTGKMIADDNVPVGEALLHGLAHNGLNRPLQGLGNIMRNRVTSANGQVQWDDTTFTGDSIWDAEEIHWSGMFARIIGAKPLNESITANAFYRDAAYDANYRRSLTKIGKKIQLNVANGGVSIGDYRSFMEDYESIGGEPQAFNAYWMRQLKDANRPVMQEFRQEIEQNNAYERMMIERRIDPPWSPVYNQGRLQLSTPETQVGEG